MKAKYAVETLLSLVSGVFDAWSVVLFQPTEEGQPAHLTAWHSPDQHINNAAVISPGKGLVGWILRNKSPLLVDSIDENQAYLGYYYENYDPAIRSFLGCPVHGGGALCLDSKNEQAFSGNNQKLLSSFAALISQIQQMAASSGYTREVNTYFTALEHMAALRAGYTGWQAYLGNILQLLRDAGGFQYAAFATLGENQTYSVEGEVPILVNQSAQPALIPLANGIGGWVLRNGEEVYNGGSTGSTTTPLFGKMPNFPDFSSSICLPVVVDKIIWGVLCLGGLEPRVFSPELRSFLHMVADDMAVLLDNIGLRYKVMKLMPKATLQTQGGVAYDPDSPKASPKPTLDA